MKVSDYEFRIWDDQFSTQKSGRHAIITHLKLFVENQFEVLTVFLFFLFLCFFLKIECEKKPTNIS